MDHTTHRTIRRFCFLVAALLIVSCSNVEHWGPRVKREREVQLSAPMRAGATLRVSTKTGPVTVQGTDGNECRVVAKIQVHATSKEKAKEFAEAIQLRLQPSAEGLELVTEAPPTAGVGEYSVSLTLFVPRPSALKLSTRAGVIRVNNIEGGVDAVTSDGDMQIENVKGNVRAKSYDGAVTCAKIEGGAVELYAAKGDIRLTNARATSCVIESADGRLYVADATAESMNLRTASGGIRCQNAAVNKLNCTSTDGSVFITWPPQASKSPDVTVALTDGSVTFEGITGMSVVLDAFTNSGPINAGKIPGLARGTSDKSLQATLGRGGGRLVLTTHDGSITIR